jgi:hypothetical protein
MVPEEVSHLLCQTSGSKKWLEARGMLLDKERQYLTDLLA